MTSTFRLTILVTGLAVATASAHPIVPGFERFQGDVRPTEAGRLLLTELNCTSCHAADGLAKKPAPVLDNVGGRVRVGHLRKFLADPHATKPGTTMPALFANDADKATKVEALVHFLASTGTPKHGRRDLRAALRGKETFARVGCAACHGPRDLNGEPTGTFASAVPLGPVKDKYTLPSLSAFLQNPMQTRPGGRMPHLLKPNEAADVAQYLLQGLKGNGPEGKGAARFSYFEGNWDRLPDFGKLKPNRTGTGPAFELGVGRREHEYGLRFEGVFKIETAGRYTFTVASDDGARLAIDGKTVVDNDGVHPTQSRSRSVQLTAGKHTVQLDYFQGGGEAVLEVEVEGPNLGRMPFGLMVVAKAEDIDKKVEPKAAVDDDAITIQPELVVKGRALFTSAGCANCHSMNEQGKPLVTTATVPAVAAMKLESGCLSARPSANVPNYALHGKQVAALTAALKNGSPAKDSAGVITQTLMTFNCYACHTRDKLGGPTEATNGLFTTTTPEMGDEGRVPPPLDGVGAKLNPDYLKKVLDQGADDRPYMHTAMPGFGAANVGHLASAFAAVDKLPAVSEVKFGVPEAKVKSSGRHMVGAQAFGCIKCHTFAGNRAEGVQGIDMLMMPKRLNRDWFHAYCVDPQKVRPGTRMPTAWPGGQSTLASVLDGQAVTQIEAIWAYLNSKNPPIPVGMGQKFIPLTPMEEAIIYRNFISGAGNRAIGVGYPEKINLAFDANDMRLAMIWKGGFIDAARHWTDRGVGSEGPLGDDVIPLHPGAAFAVLDKADAPWPTTAPKQQGYRFLGYKLTADDRPTFRYEYGGVTIEDFPNPSSKDNPTLRRAFALRADKPVNGLYYRAAVGTAIEAQADGWFKVDGMRIRIEGAKPTIRTSGGKKELIVPVDLADGKAKFVQEIAW